MYKKFEKLLEEKDVTAYQVAQATGIAMATLSSWKSGAYIPKVDKLMKIADYFDVPLEYFVKEEP